MSLKRCFLGFGSAAVMSLVSLVGVESSAVDFDQGIDAVGVLRSVEQIASDPLKTATPPIVDGQSASWFLHPRLEAQSLIDPRDPVKLRMFGAIGPLHNRLFNYVNDHQGYAQLMNLYVDPRIFDVSVEIRERLRAEGGELTSQRNDMLPRAKELDATDTALAEEREKIDASKRDLDARSDRIDQEAAEHDRICLPTHPPEQHEWCVANAARLNAIIDKYNADIRIHNAWYQDWRSRLDSFIPVWNAFVNVIRAWESLINPLIEKINKAFSKPRTCSDERYEQLKERIRINCKEPPVSACRDGDSCDLLRAKKLRFLACADSRETMSNECFGGADNGHQEQANNMRSGAKNCDPLIAVVCGVGVMGDHSGWLWQR